MNLKAPSHQDCREYIPVDVFQGICRVNQDRIIPDTDACERFFPVKKCRYCTLYHEVEADLGTCKGKNPAYPDMIAKTCGDFEWEERVLHKYY